MSERKRSFVQSVRADAQKKVPQLGPARTVIAVWNQRVVRDARTAASATDHGRWDFFSNLQKLLGQQRVDWNVAVERSR